MISAERLNVIEQGLATDSPIRELVEEIRRLYKRTALNPTEPPSKMFSDLVCTGGTMVASCDLCGRTHFATGDHADLSEPDIKRYRDLAALSPSVYVEDRVNDSVAVGEIGGAIVVWNCPCNRLRLYENLIWESRGLIIAYLKKRTAADRAMIERTEEAMANLR